MSQHAVSTIREQVYSMLKEAICTGKFAPGQKLAETELAEFYQVSRSPIRESLRQLASEGLVVEIPNRGVFVRKYSAKDITEIFELRVLLENYAIDCLRTTLSTEHQHILLDLLGQLKSSWESGDLDQYISVDTQLHNQFIALSDNQLLWDLYQQVYGHILRFRRYSLTQKLRFDDSLGEHTDIIRSILSRDTETAQEVNRRHLRLARDQVIQYLKP